MKVRDVIKLIEEAGWYLARTKGDHRQYKHRFRVGLVTIAGHLNDDIAKGTLNSILKQAGLKEGGKDA
jgi:predicted RNA binding protein YcfA (HicA-like mRNA interferase family)